MSSVKWSSKVLFASIVMAILLAAPVEEAGAAAMAWVAGTATVVAGAAWLAINLPAAREAGDACDFGSSGCAGALALQNVDRRWADSSASSTDSVAFGDAAHTDSMGGASGGGSIELVP